MTARIYAGRAHLNPLPTASSVEAGGELVKTKTVLPCDFVYDAAATVIIPSTPGDKTFQLAARIELEDAA